MTTQQYLLENETLKQTMKNPQDIATAMNVGDEVLQALGLTSDHASGYINRIVIDINANKEVDVAIHRLVTLQQMETGLRAFTSYKLVPKE
jgi:hypothetical protein